MPLRRNGKTALTVSHCQIYLCLLGARARVSNALSLPLSLSLSLSLSIPIFLSLFLFLLLSRTLHAALANQRIGAAGEVVLEGRLQDFARSQAGGAVPGGGGGRAAWLRRTQLLLAMVGRAQEML